MEKVTSKKASRNRQIGAVVLGIVALAAIVAWVYQCITGLHVTAMRDLNSWGLYITLFMFFVGLSAGGLIISSAPKVFDLKGFDGVSKVAVLASIICTIAAIAFVIVDLGHPERAWHLFVYGRLGSPLMWDMIILFVYLILSIVYLRLLIKNEKDPSNAKALRVNSVISFIVAILVHSVTAWIFALNASRPFWNTALMAPWFVASALVSGLALIILVVVALKKAGYLHTSDESMQKMGKLLGIFVAVDLFFFFCEILTSVFPGNGIHFELIMELLAGPLAPFFWTEIVGGIIAMVIVFTPALRKRTTLIVVAAILGCVGVLCKRIQLIEDGFQIPNIAYPGVSTSSAIPGADGLWQSIGSSLAYWPTGFEIFVAIGIIALGGCLFLLGINYLPVDDKKRSDIENDQYEAIP